MVPKKSEDGRYFGLPSSRFGQLLFIISSLQICVQLQFREISHQELNYGTVLSLLEQLFSKYNSWTDSNRQDGIGQECKFLGPSPCLTN